MFQLGAASLAKVLLASRLLAGATFPDRSRGFDTSDPYVASVTRYLSPAERGDPTVTHVTPVPFA